MTSHSNDDPTPEDSRIFLTFNGLQRGVPQLETPAIPIVETFIDPSNFAALRERVDRTLAGQFCAGDYIFISKQSDPFVLIHTLLFLFSHDYPIKVVEYDTLTRDFKLHTFNPLSKQWRTTIPASI